MFERHSSSWKASTRFGDSGSGVGVCRGWGWCEAPEQAVRW